MIQTMIIYYFFCYIYFFNIIWRLHALSDMMSALSQSFAITLHFWDSRGSEGGSRGCRPLTPGTWAETWSDSATSAPHSYVCTLWHGSGPTSQTPLPRSCWRDLWDGERWQKGLNNKEWKGGRRNEKVGQHARFIIKMTIYQGKSYQHEEYSAFFFF